MLSCLPLEKSRLTLLLAFAISHCVGSCSGSSHGAESEPGAPVADSLPASEAEGGPTAATAAGPGKLAGLGYSGAYEEGGELTGAITHDAERIEPGLTLLCSGHDTSVVLLDVDGTVVYQWRLDFEEIFPDPMPFEANEVHATFVRRAWPFPNGDLLAVFEYTGITRVDRTGKPLWALANQTHHDFKVLQDGTIVTLDLARRDGAWMRKKYGTKRFKAGFADSHVLFLSPEGDVLRKISILEALHRSRFAGLINTFPTELEDVFHANSIDVLDAAHAAAFPSFDEGDLLVSLRNISTLVVIDGKSEEVKWISTGLTVVQHQASFQPTGSILVLDNAGGNQKRPLRLDQSRVIELSPVSQEILWRYPPLGRHLKFFTGMLGYVERLPGGNTLITESMKGRVMEVSAEGKLAWEYLSPYRDGENDKLVTTLMGARRILRAALPFLDE